MPVSVICVMEYIVTIGMPVYNVQAFIRESLESALSQTSDAIEFLIIDDCGFDDSVGIVRELQAQHPRGHDVRIIRQPKNMGPGEARNKVIEKAKGKYLYFMDADDIIEPTTIELLHKTLVDNNADICFGSYDQTKDFDGENERFVYQYPQQVFSCNDDFGNFVFRKYDGMQTSACNFLIAKDIFLLNGLRFLPIYYWEDMTMMMRLPAYVNKAVTLPDITYHYKCHYDSLSNFNKREYIPKQEIQVTVSAIERVKVDTLALVDKSYYFGLLSKLLKSNFYIVCTILQHQQEIVPPFSTKEIRLMMKSPISLERMVRQPHMNVVSLFFCLIGKLPSALLVFVIRQLGKRKGYIA